jgi:hypothetical protein
VNQQEQIMYHGPAFGNPSATKVHESDGWLSVQSLELQAAIAFLRGERNRAEPIPQFIELEMIDGSTIQSQAVGEQTVVNPTTGHVRILLGQWNRERFEWCTVDIQDDDIHVMVYRNPPETENLWRPERPTVIAL